MASRGPVAASSPFTVLDRAMSPPLKPFSIPSLASNLCPRRSYSSLDLDKSPFFIEHFEPHRPHLPIACLALQLSDCSDRCGLPSEISGIHCLSGAASLLGLLHVSVVRFKHRSIHRHIRFAEARGFRRKGRPPVAFCQSHGDSRSSQNDGADDGVSSKMNSGPQVGAPRILREAKLVTYCNTETQSHNTLSDSLEDEDLNIKGIKGLKQSSDVENLFNTYQPIPECPLIEDTFSGRQQSDSTTQRIDTGGQESGNCVSETRGFGNEQKNSNFSTSSLIESVTMTVKEPIYKVLEVNSHGIAVTKSVSRRQLLKSSGLRLRDVRSVDPSLWVTNSMPALLIRDHAILLNLGSLRAIATRENVLIFDHKSIGAATFLDLLLPRLNSDASVGTLTMPFELEVVEAALLSRTQQLERRLMDVEPRVLALLEVLPNRLTANILEELRLSKQALVELGSKAGALRQMLLELLESPQEIRRMTIMGRQCFMRKDDGSIECTASVDKRLADDEEQEMEMLLENYLQRCESCHGQAERLLDSAKETEDSIAVNLSSRRLEVSRLELLLQVGTFCSALGALVAGIFGMNLRSYLEASTIAFWLTTAGIILGGLVLFFVTYNYLKQKRIL